MTSPELWRRVEAHPRRPAGAEARRARQHGDSAAEAERRHRRSGTTSWTTQSDEFEIEQTGLEDYSIMHYTSGTTGKPKGAAHVHKAVIGPLRDRQVRARPPRRRHLLVHRRPGLGDRHVLRHVRAVDQRRDVA